MTRQVSCHSLTQLSYVGIVRLTGKPRVEWTNGIEEYLSEKGITVILDKEGN